MINRQRGSVTMVAIIMVMFLAILASTANTLVNSDLRMSKTNSDAIEAQFAAEAGAKRAISMFYQKNQDWTWLDANSTPIWQSLSTDQNKSYHVKTELASAQVVPVNPAVGGVYTITSIGKVRGTIKKVTVTVTVTGNSGASILNKYALYSKNDTYIWGGNGPNIKGDMGLAGGNKVKIDSGYNFLQGKLHVTSIPTGWHDWLTSAMYVIDPDIGTLSVVIPPLPTLPVISTSIPTGADIITGPNTASMPNSVYYSTALSDFGGGLIAGSSDTTLYATNGLHLTNKGSSYNKGWITASNGNLKIYINGDANLSNGSYINSKGNIEIYVSGSLSMSGASYIKSDNGNVTIIANQEINLTDNNNYIQAAIKGKSEIYSLKNSINLSNSCYINGGTVTLEAQSNVNFANSSSINKSNTYSNAIAFIYANGSTFTNDVVIGGAASQVITTGPFNINSNVYAPNTLFVSASGQTQISNNPTIGCLYTNGSLSVSNTPTIIPNANAISLITGGSTPSITVNNWGN
ncbi:pilus assembly PilX N-terminal domain-containing protein [Pelosinus sp. sgz500959]|uniref:pilus assembly PilX N-terminal domain-containing protein n=1 Tax=Pelosinus sp. sgz500959 TaxID=3242472 RepID=UPI00366C4FC4